MHAAAVEAARAADPEATIDFLPVMPFFGMVVGGFGAALIGMILGLLFPSKKASA